MKNIYFVIYLLLLVHNRVLFQRKTVKWKTSSHNFIFFKYLLHFITSPYFSYPLNLLCASFYDLKLWKLSIKLFHAFTKMSEPNMILICNKMTLTHLPLSKTTNSTQSFHVKFIRNSKRKQCHLDHAIMVMPSWSYHLWLNWKIK